jgi:prepilin-type N-terminal cleavage/methylation domain-containing protein
MEEILKNNLPAKGFTLIELLVVIAIIGLLATIVTVNVNDARKKAQDSTIKGTLNSLRTGAALYYDSVTGGNSTYNNFCTIAGGDAQKAQTAINNISAGGYYCTSSTSSFAVYGQLKFAVGKFWCVDSDGDGVQENASSTNLCI